MDFDLQELMLVSFPWLLVEAGIICMSILFFDPMRLQFSYSLLPQEYQNNWVLGCFVLTEYFLFNIEFAAYGFGVFLQLAFFRYCLGRLNNYE